MLNGDVWKQVPLYALQVTDLLPWLCGYISHYAVRVVHFPLIALVSIQKFLGFSPVWAHDETG